jgi:large subunit ribosomal protein L19e
MQLAKKKALAAKTLGIGKERISFDNSSLAEIKEAITRQDIIDLHNSGAIKIKEINGRRKKEKRNNRRRTGKVKKKIKNLKREYLLITRKLRKYSRFLLKTNKIKNEKYTKLRKMIKAKKFKSKRHLNELIGEI